METTQLGATSTVYVYGAMGNLAAEYSTAAPEQSERFYLTTDHLGTTRVVTNQSGEVMERRDYLPFGEEYEPIPGDPRLTEVAGYAPATNLGVQLRFTGKERDAESGLDFFGASVVRQAD